MAHGQAGLLTASEPGFPTFGRSHYPATQYNFGVIFKLLVTRSGDSEACPPRLHLGTRFLAGTGVVEQKLARSFT